MKLPTQLTIRDHLGKEWSFDTLEAFETFLKGQASFWSQRQDIANQSPMASSFIQKYSGFQTIINQIESWKPQFDTWDAAAFNSNFTSIINSYITTSWLWGGYPFIEKWLELIDTSSNTADAFFEALVQKTTSRFANGIYFFQGYVIAYEFINQENTEINKRRNSEKKSLSKLSDQLTTKHDELIGNVDKFETGLTEWKDTTESDFSEWYTKQKTFFDETILAQSKSFHEQLASWTDKQTNLENLYQEKLRFEGAAKYWATKASSLNGQGRKWANCLVLSVLLGGCLFSLFFLTWLEGKQPIVSFKSLEGALLFITILSSYAFLVKSMAKLTFSAFHLQRDAEEREQLTHLYLNLREGANDDVESRRIILQSLFSRSESGLLSNETGPTMPIQDLIQIIKK